MSFEYQPHTADLKVLLQAKDETDLWAEAARMVRLTLIGNSGVRSTLTHEIVLAPSDLDERLFLFVRELLFLFDTQGFLPATASPSGREPATVRVSGETFDVARHRCERQIKALTRHEFSVERSAEGLRAILLFDL